MEGSFTNNVTKRVSFTDAIMQVNIVNFGRITAARGADLGGARVGHVSARFDF